MQYKDMRVGDRVEITDKRTVTISKIDEAENAFDQFGRIIMDDTDREFGLIERPVPELPTERGSVISVKHGSISSGAHWMLLETGEWVSLLDIHKKPEDLRDFIVRSKLTFEVIA